MAFATVEATNTTNGTAASSTPALNLPTGIRPGDLLIVGVRVAVAGTHTFPEGWNALFSSSTADASDDVTSCYYRYANGAEGATVTITSGNGKFASIAYRVAGHEAADVQIPQRSTLNTGTDAAPDPPALSPAGGAKDYLWLWWGACEGEQTSPPAGNPANYTDPLGANSGVGGAITTNVRIFSARRELNAASEDPPSWAISVSDDWTAWTVAIHPAGQPILVTPRAAA